MTKIPKSNSMDNNNQCDNMEIPTLNSRKNNYKIQKPILEKRRRDRINGSLDELKNLLLAIKQRDPLRYARLEKADILEMVVKYLKDLKKRRQAMIAAMEPMLFRSFKMGYLDCTRTTIDFINEIETPAERKQQIIDHISKECMKTLQNQCPMTNFTQHHEIMFANVNPPEHFITFPPLLTTSPSEMEWPSLEEKLGFSPIGKTKFMLPDLPSSSSTSSLLKIAEQRKSSSQSLESPSTSGISEMPHEPSIFMNDTSDDDDDENEKLIIDDHNNNQTAWRPWL
ncbi:hypothetical protein PVAND_005466 [Polypedilum vanderplanki]|uniref:BHLH domain-containing protein n=1 Tax=Polypedilum vanderplanki TaxID=319348 RepID=A0A9J6C094_POLVA|nr:hypothetical protein PVAND_005466 [Polypedilum vanderplanki]